MEIKACALFLAFAALLNSIGLIISITTTLENLFPGYNCVLPPIRDFPTQRLLRLRSDYTRLRLLQLRSEFARQRLLHLEFENPQHEPGDDGRAPPWDFLHFHFVAREHVIVGVKNGILIQDPCTIFREHDQFIVYDTNNIRWVTLHPDEYRKLGPNRLLPLIEARDEAADRYPLRSNHPRDKLAHDAACEQANYETDRVERREVEKIYNGTTTIDLSIDAVKGEYIHVYTDVFAHYFLGQNTRNYNRNRP